MADIKKMQPVEACKDNNGHWYVIPVKMRRKFNQMLEKATDEDYDAQESFEEKFGKYRTGGDLNIVQLYAEI